MKEGNLCDLQYCSDYNFSVVFPISGLNAVKIIDYIRKSFKQKLSRINFPAKNSGGGGSRSLFLPGVELGGAKHLQRTGMKKDVPFGAEGFQNYRLY